MVTAAGSQVQPVGMMLLRSSSGAVLTPVTIRFHQLLWLLEQNTLLSGKAQTQLSRAPTYAALQTRVICSFQSKPILTCGQGNS